MPNFDYKEVALASVYAASLLALARERKEEADVGEELEQLVDALGKHPYLPSFLTSPTVDVDRRRDTLEKMFRGRASKSFVDGLQILNRNGRLNLIRAISFRYRELLRESQGHLKAEVQTASPLSAAHQERLREAIQRRTGKEVDFELKVDPELIGGIVIQIGDRKVDASTSRKLRTLSEAMMDRASREVLRSSEYVS